MDDETTSILKQDWVIYMVFTTLWQLFYNNLDCQIYFIIIKSMYSFELSS